MISSSIYVRYRQNQDTLGPCRSLSDTFSPLLEIVSVCRGLAKAPVASHNRINSLVIAALSLSIDKQLDILNYDNSSTSTYVISIVPTRPKFLRRMTTLERKVI